MNGDRNGCNRHQKKRLNAGANQKKIAKNREEFEEKNIGEIRILRKFVQSQTNKKKNESFKSFSSFASDDDESEDLIPLCENKELEEEEDEIRKKT